ncbi:TPA: hypothetical protein ACK3AM_005342, partial [Klebsiella pneumoniae]
EVNIWEYLIKRFLALRLQVKYYTDVRLDASLSGAGLSSIAYVTKRALRAANSRRIFGKSKDEKSQKPSSAKRR